MAKYRRCKGCRDLCSELNRKGYCLTCAMARMVKAADQMKAKKGYYYNKWCRAMRKLGREL